MGKRKKSRRNTNKLNIKKLYKKLDINNDKKSMALNTINVKSKEVEFEGNKLLKEPFKDLNIHDLIKSKEVSLINEAFEFYNKDRLDLVDILHSNISLNEKYDIVVKNKTILSKINKERYLFKLSENKNTLKKVPQVCGQILELIVYRSLLKCKLNVDYERDFHVLGKNITPDFYINDLNRLVEVKLTKNLASFNNKRLYHLVDKNLLVVYLKDIKNNDEGNRNKDTDDLSVGGKIDIYKFMSLLEDKYKVDLSDEYHLSKILEDEMMNNRKYAVGNISLLPGSKISALLHKMDRELRELSAELDCLESELKVRIKNNTHLSQFTTSVKGVSLRVNKLYKILIKFEEKGYKGSVLENYLMKELDVNKEDLKEYFNIKTMTLDTILELESVLDNLK